MPVITKHFSPNLLPREAQDFPRGDNHSKDTLQLTYLTWLQPIYYDPELVFKHVKTEKKITCGEDFNKKI